MRQNLLLITLLVFSLVFAGCNSGGGSDDDDGDNNDIVAPDDDDDNSDGCCPDDTPADPPEIVDQSVYLSTSNFLMIKVEVEADENSTACAEYSADGENFKRTPMVQLAVGESVTITVMGLKPSTLYYVRPVVVGEGGASAAGEIVEITTGDWPAEWPWPTAYDLSGGRGYTELGWTDDEVFCFPQSLSNINLYMCTDREGTPVWYFHHPDGVWVPFVHAMSDGTFASNVNSKIIFFDTEGNVIKEFSKDWFDGRTRFVHDSQHHDLIEITEGDWKGAVAILTHSVDDVEFEGIPDPATREVEADGIIVLDYKNEEVLWDWQLHGEMGDNQTIHPAKFPYTYWGFYGTIIKDWTHSNALLHGVDDGGDFFWMSVRHQSWIIKIDVATDKILWRFGLNGDFALVDDIDSSSPTMAPIQDYMYFQHSPEWISHADGRYKFIVFDNGDVRPDNYGNPQWGATKYSRVVGFELDESSRKAQIIFDYGSSNPDADEYFYADAVGDADMLPGGESLIFTKGWFDMSWWQSGGVGSPNVFLKEISYPAGDDLWKLDLSDADSPDTTFVSKGTVYRSSYFPSIYDTKWWSEVDR